MSLRKPRNELETEKIEIQSKRNSQKFKTPM